MGPRNATLKNLVRNVIWLLALCQLAATVASAQATADKSAPRGAEQLVRVGVYLESLCPDSRRFFLNQLTPTHREIGPIMQLKIVPFGHARTLGNNRMICQHGPRECEGNRRMACLMARSRNQTEIVETFDCLFRGQAAPRECVNNNMAGVDFDDIEKCKTADESYRLMEEAERETGRVGYVPKLTENGQHSEDIQEGLEHDLLDSVCKAYKGSAQIDACKGAPSASVFQ